MGIGQNIKRARINNRLSQSELADKVGITRISIGHYERDIRLPPIETLKKISKALNISIDDLYLSEDNKLDKYIDFCHKAGFTVEVNFDMSKSTKYITIDGKGFFASLVETEFIKKMDEVIVAFESQTKPILASKIQAAFSCFDGLKVIGMDKPLSAKEFFDKIRHREIKLLNKDNNQEIEIIDSPLEEKEILEIELEVVLAHYYKSTDKKEREDLQTSIDKIMNKLNKIKKQDTI